MTGLESFTFILNRLSGFPRLLARHDLCGGLYDHRQLITKSSRRKNLAFAKVWGVGQISPSAALRTLPDTRIALRPRLAE